MNIQCSVNCRRRSATRAELSGLPQRALPRLGFQRTALLPVPGGVFGEGVVFWVGVVFAGIRVALAGPFWPGGAAPRGVAIFVPDLPSAPCKRSMVEWFLRLGKIPATRCQCQPHSTTVTPNEAKVGVTLCQPDTTNVLYNDEGLLGTQIHSPSQMPTFSSWRDILHEFSARAELTYLIKSQQSLQQ